MTWKFDREVAEIFPTHARAHIPNYDQVISLSVEIARLFGREACIIDVGVATGETISKLSQAGFNNLVGVDNSQDMLDRCPKGIAKLIHSSEFPDGKYDVVIINWTLHFIEDKLNYLSKVFNCLNEGGILILSEKTANESLPKTFYHNFKRLNGVSDTEILQKEKSLENAMFLNDIPWYFKALNQIGFEKVYVANAFWCFTTFVCVK